MSTVRVNKTREYSVISNIPLNDEKLSWKAKGLMGYLLSKPDDWRVMVADLIKQSPGGESQVRSALKELAKAGYIARLRVRKGNGQVYWLTDIYESPDKNPYTLPEGKSFIDVDETTTTETSYGKPTSGLPKSGKPPSLLSTDSASTEKQSIEREESPPPPFDPKDFIHNQELAADMMPVFDDDLQFDQMKAILAVTCGLVVDFPKHEGWLDPVSSSLVKVGVTAEQVQAAYIGPRSWWYVVDWRGQKGNRPKLANIEETFKQAIEWDGNANGNGRTGIVEIG